MVKYINLQIQVDPTANSINTKNYSQAHHSKTAENQRLKTKTLKVAGENQHITCREINDSSDFKVLIKNRGGQKTMSTRSSRPKKIALKNENNMKTCNYLKRI